MPTTNIIGLTDAEVAIVQGIGGATEDDLSYTKFVDYPITIPVVKRRKLELLTQYLANGNALDANALDATMDDG